MNSRIFERIMDPIMPTYIVAEIGINHNGSLDLAKQTIDAAIESGVDAVKFQNFATADFITDPTLTYSYENAGKTVTEKMIDMFRRVEMDDDFLAEIGRYCNERGVDWHSTPTNSEGIQRLIELNVPVLKNGSDYLGHLPLISEMAAAQKLLVLSTGMATFEDIEDAVSAALSEGNDQIVILHCTSQYPTPPGEVGMKRMTRIAAAFGLPVGFSDHTLGSTAAVAAVALGARWLEKHFTLDRGLSGPDHNMSEDPETMKSYVSDIRNLEEMLVRDTFLLSEREREARAAHRLSCAASRDLSAGMRISAEDIRFARPGHGYPPKFADMLLGRALRRDIGCGTLFSDADFV